ncbi:MAG: hypothetical protein JW966_00125 [Anaerolineae bacterium]|nr:hypothetical protein [Anaerolineae bacterium]
MNRISVRCWLSLVFVIGLAVPAVRITAPAQAAPLTAQSRPKLSGEEHTYGTSHFLIHYTLFGVDGVPNTDRNSNSTPDWVEEVGRVMEDVWSVEINSEGWPAPLPDRGEGGDERFDVYLMELFSNNIAGYVSPDGGFVGDNPNTPGKETQAAYGYMVLDNDFVDPNPPASLKVWPAADWLRIIASHEFNHAAQIAINGTHAMRWFYESTANWMETQVFPNLPDNLESADAVFKSPDTCIMRYGGVNRVESGLHWYGMWVFNQMLSEQYGSSIIRDIWLAMGSGYGYEPFDSVFEKHGTSFEAEMERFALWVLLRHFRSGSDYPTPRLQEAVNADGEWNPVDGVQRYAMDYIGLELSGTHTITVSSDDDGVTGIVVGMRGSTANVYAAGNTTTVNFDEYDHAYLMVLNLTRPPNEAGCATARYTYAVTPADGDPSGVAYSVTSSDFSAPRVEAVTDPEDVPITDPFYQTEYNIKDEIETVDVPFDPIVPRGKPSGYELDSVYGMDADEQGEEFVAMNAPSGGIVVQMLYYNAQGQLMRLTESPSTFVTIGEWMAENHLEFKPGVVVWTTGNVDTALIDKSGGSGSGPYSVTFIVRERFITIDGDASKEDMLEMAAWFASSFGAGLPEPRGPAPDFGGLAFLLN